MTKDRIDDARHADGIDDGADEPRSTDHGSGADRRSAVSEGELEHVVRHDWDAGRAVNRQHANISHENHAFGGVTRHVPADESVAATEHEGEAKRPMEKPAHAGVEHAF